MPFQFTRRDELPDLPFGRYRPVGIPVRAVQLDVAGSARNPFARNGSFLGQGGDWRITYGKQADGEPDTAICDRQVFEETYEHLEGDRYRRRPIVIEAAQLTASLDIITMEGPSRGEPGDWIVIGARGQSYFNADGYFREHYKPVEP